MQEEAEVKSELVAKNPKEMGGILKRAREKKGFTIEKIYTKTRIQPKIVEALEEGSAAETLNRVYLLLFLNRYASFLGLNGEDLVRDYKTFYDGEERGAQNVKKLPVTMGVAKEKWKALAIPIGTVFMVFIFVFLTLFLGIKLKSFYNARKTTDVKRIVSTAEIPKAIPKQASTQKNQTIFPIPQDKRINLTLRSTDDVWMKIKGDGKVVYVGTLIKNGTKELSADNEINLWLGRAEVLEVTINGTPIGKIGEGTIRSVQISRRGLKIGDKWLLKQAE